MPWFNSSCSGNTVKLDFLKVLPSIELHNERHFFKCSFLSEKLLLSLQQHHSNRKVVLLGSTLVPTTVLVMESARLVTQPPAECTANVTNIGRGKLATSRTVGTTAEAPTTATATSLGRSCASATTAGKVRGSSVLATMMEKGQRFLLMPVTWEQLETPLC